jgi:hypothetical protein
MSEAQGPFVFYDVRTKALAKSKDFYTAMFGWKVDDVPAGDKTLSFLSGPEGPWAGFTELPEGDERVPQWIPYVPVPDVDGARDQAERLGAAVIRERTELPEGSLVVITDPGGAAVVLWQKR